MFHMGQPGYRLTQIETLQQAAVLLRLWQFVITSSLGELLLSVRGSGVIIFGCGIRFVILIVWHLLAQRYVWLNKHVHPMKVAGWDVTLQLISQTSLVTKSMWTMQCQAYVALLACMLIGNYWKVLLYLGLLLHGVRPSTVVTVEQMPYHCRSETTHRYVVW